MDECSNHFLMNVGREFSFVKMCELLVKVIVGSGQTELSELQVRERLEGGFDGIYYRFSLKGFSVYVFRPEVDILLNYVDVTLFFYQEQDELATELMVRLIRELYKVARKPGVGFSFKDYRPGLKELSEDACEKMLHGHEILLYDKVWSVNLFCPVDVARLGRERLLGAPCELIEEWDDGAIFMMIHKNTFLSSFEEREKLRDYLAEDKIRKRLR